MTAHRCSICGAVTQETRQKIRYDSGTGPLVLNDVPVHQCPGCGDCEITLTRVPLLRTELALAIARKPPPLAPREVRFLREYLGMTREELADTVGTNEAVAAKWEDVDDQQLMALPQERMLRLLVVSGRKTGQA